jgi:hypothetical protein
MGLGERGYLNLSYVSSDTQNGSFFEQVKTGLYDTLLEAINIVFETYFGFGFPNRSHIGDSLKQTYGPWSK